MIGKLIRGRSMRGLLDYLFAQKDQKGEERPRVHIVGGTFAGHTPRLIASEFAALRALRTGLNVAVVHETLRLPPTAAEPSDAEWLAIAKYWAQEMGFESWVAVAHGDRHVHLACSRILVNGDVISDSNDWTKSETIVRQIEDKFGLDNIEPSHLLNPDRDWLQRAPTRQQLAIVARTGSVPPSEIVANVIDAILSKPTSIWAFLSGMEAAGIDVRPNISATTGLMSGFAFRVGDITLTAKAMGRAYTFAALQKRGLVFDAVDDARLLQEAREMSLERERRAAMDRAAAIAVGASNELSDSTAKTVSGSETLSFESLSQFVSAIGCDQFEVHLERQSDKVLTRSRTFSADQLLGVATLGDLRKHNKAGANVHIRPVDRRVVVLSDVSAHSLESMRSEGFEPAVVTMTSPLSFNVWVRLLPISEPEPSPEVSAQAATLLRQRYSDTLDNRGAGLAPGFVNRDPMRRMRKRYPWISIQERARTIATYGAELLRRVAVLLSEWARVTQRGARPEDLSPREFYVQSVGKASSSVTQIDLDIGAVEAMLALKHERHATSELIASLSPDVDAIVNGTTYASQIVDEFYANQIEPNLDSPRASMSEMDGP